MAVSDTGWLLHKCAVHEHLCFACSVPMHPGLEANCESESDTTVVNALFLESESGILRMSVTRMQISFRTLSLTTVGGAAIATQSQHGGRVVDVGKQILHQLLWKPSLNIRVHTKLQGNCKLKKGVSNQGWASVLFKRMFRSL